MFRGVVDAAEGMYEANTDGPTFMGMFGYPDGAHLMQ